MAKRYELTAPQWCKIEPLLPGKSGGPGRSGTDNRLFVKGDLWVLRSGAHWHDLPERYGKWKTVHKRFTRWAEAGVWERVFEHLIEDPDNSYVSLDSSMVRAHQQAATGKGPKGAQKGGPGSGAIPRGSDDQDTSGNRCPWPALARDPDTGPAW